MTGKEFLSQYVMVDRQIKSLQIQLDSMRKMSESGSGQDVFKAECANLSCKLKSFVSKSVTLKQDILDKIQHIENYERREILTKRYIQEKTIANISREMFMTSTGVRYHLDKGEKEVEKMT